MANLGCTFNSPIEDCRVKSAAIGPEPGSLIPSYGGTIVAERIAARPNVVHVTGTVNDNAKDPSDTITSVLPS
jgi:hypothetical protein